MKKNFKWMLSLLVAVFAVSMIGNTAFAASFENIEDGTYDLTVTSLEDGSDEVSVADDFVNEPTLTIKDGNPSLTLKIGASGGDYSDFDFNIEWVNVEGNEPTDSSEEGDFTYYTFALDKLDTIVPAQMEYVVPGFPGLEDGHEVNFDLKLSGLDGLPEKEAEGPKDDNGDENDNGENNGENDDGETNTGGTEDNGGNGDNGEGTTEDNGDNEEDNGGAVADNGDNGSATTDGEKVTNPQTGDTTNIWFYALLLIGSITIPATILFKRRFAHK